MAIEDSFPADSSEALPGSAAVAVDTAAFLARLVNRQGLPSTPEELRRDCIYHAINTLQFPHEQIGNENRIDFNEVLAIADKYWEFIRDGV